MNQSETLTRQKEKKQKNPKSAKDQHLSQYIWKCAGFFFHKHLSELQLLLLTLVSSPLREFSSRQDLSRELSSSWYRDLFLLPSNPIRSNNISTTKTQRYRSVSPTFSLLSEFELSCLFFSFCRKVHAFTFYRVLDLNNASKVSDFNRSEIKSLTFVSV